MLVLGLLVLRDAVIAVAGRRPDIDLARSQEVLRVGRLLEDEHQHLVVFRVDHGHLDPVTGVDVIE
eukprot:9828885-Heterocapsa_arctica.AAC.1